MAQEGLPKITVQYINGDAPEEAAEDVTDFIRVTVRKKLKAKSNTVSILLKNNFKKWVDPTDGLLRIKDNDSFKIYVKMSNDQTDVDLSPGSSDLMIIGDVQAISSNFSEQGTFYDIKLADRTNIMLNKVWSKVYPTDLGFTAPIIIQDVINQRVNEESSDPFNDPKIDVTLVNYPSRDGIQQTRPDGSAFPVVAKTMLWKPLYDWIQELSQTQNTNSPAELAAGTLIANKGYIFFVDEFNKFRWFFPDSDDVDVVRDANLRYFAGSTSGEAIANEISSKLDKKIFNVINTVYFKCGTDLENNGIIGFHFDTSTALTGKQTFRPFTDISKDMKFSEFREGNLDFNSTTGNYDFKDIYPFTPTWGGAAVTDDASYNASFRTEAKSIGISKAQRITSQTATLRFKGNITLSGVKLNPGEVVLYSNDKMGILNVSLRIQAVDHQITKNDWSTILDVEEDEIGQVA